MKRSIKKEQTEKLRKKTLFDHLNAIYLNKSLEYYDKLDESDKKSFNVYMINRFISMNPSYISIVNELQRYWDSISAREAYLFYSQLLPRGKQFNRYIKSNKTEDVGKDTIELLANHYEVSQFEAEEMLQVILSNKQGDSWLKELRTMYGRDKD